MGGIYGLKLELGRRCGACPCWPSACAAWVGPNVAAAPIIPIATFATGEHYFGGPATPQEAAQANDGVERLAGSIPQHGEACMLSSRFIAKVVDGQAAPRGLPAENEG